jgi:hypothetical protein
MIATIDTPNSLISVPPGIIKFDTEGIAYIVMQNCAPYAIWIERNGPMEFAEHHTEEARLEKLDKKFVANLLQQVTICSVAQDKSNHWTDEAKREHIKEHATNNVPSQYKYKYKELILKHFKNCEDWKNDLGGVKDFFTKYTLPMVHFFKKLWRTCLILP